MTFITGPYKEGQPNFPLDLFKFWNTAPMAKAHQKTKLTSSYGASVSLSSYDVYLTLAILNKYTDDGKNICIDHHRTTFDTNNIQYYKEQKEIPSSFYSGNFTIKDSNLIIKLNHVRAGADIIDAIDTFKQDQKILSIGLQAHQRHKVRVYTDLKPNTLSVITSEYSWELLRKAIALLPVTFPNFFQGIPTEVLEILQHYGNGDYDKWYAAVHKWLTEQDFWKDQVTDFLTKLFNYKKIGVLDNLKRQIENIRQDIKTYEHHVTTCYKALLEANQKYLGVTLEADSDPTPVIDYVLKVKYIADMYVDRDNLYLLVQAPIVHYDKHFLIRYLNRNAKFVSDNTIDAVLKAALIDEKFQLYMETGVLLNTTTTAVSTTGSLVKNQYIQHTHLMQYDCWGDNRPYIQKALSNGDLLIAIDQIIAAAENFNFTDSVVFNSFLTNLRNDGRKTIYDPKTDKFYTFKEADAILVEEAEAEAARLAAIEAKSKAEEEAPAKKATRTRPKAVKVEADQDEVTNLFDL